MAKNRKLWLVGNSDGIEKFSDFNFEEVYICETEEIANIKALGKVNDDFDDSFIIEVEVKSIKQTKSQVVTQPWNI